MFNFGKVIKVFSIIFSFLLFIGILIGGAIILNSMHIYDNANLFIIIGVIGLLISFTIFLVLYGFGTLIDTNVQILIHLKNENK